jgi:hypothetical protein
VKIFVVEVCGNRFDEAQAYIYNSGLVGFSVYGIMAVWGIDTEQNVENDWHDLLLTSDLVKV